MYEPKLKEAIFQRLQEFLSEELNNRLTKNNMTGLGVTLESIFQKYWIEPEKKEGEE